MSRPKSISNEIPTSGNCCTKYLRLIDQVESIRSKNNSNWMDILRLAFKHAPKESAEIMSQINNKDKSG